MFVPSFHLLAPRRWLTPSALLLALSAACVPARPAAEARAGNESEPGSLTVSGAQPTPGARAVAISEERPATAPGTVAGAGLDRGLVIREVLAKNPDIDARRAAWRAARSKGRQVDSLDDPMLGYEIAPLSVVSKMRFGQTVRLSQRFPWPGKLANASEAEERAAAASGHELELTELDLALEASLLYDEYWLVDRSAEVNSEHRNLLGELKRSAEIQYSVGRASLSDPLQAELEIAMLEEQDLGLASRRDIVVTQLNALLHRPPQRPLPAPPADLGVVLSIPPASVDLQRRAVASSPELKKLAAKSRAAQARIRYAERQYYPDVTLMASYSSMFAEIEHQFMLGFEAPIPVQRGSRAGMVDEASAMAAELDHDAKSVTDRIRARVEVDRRRVVEAIQVVTLYDSRLIPTARSQVAAARADFGAGNTNFATVISAEKSLRNVQLARHAAAAELSKRRARLDRSQGRFPLGSRKGGAR